MNKHMKIKLYSIAICLLAPMAFTADAMAQGDEKRSEQSQHQQTDQNDLLQQMRAMQTKIASLEAALKQNHSATQQERSDHESHDNGTSQEEQTQGMDKMSNMAMDGDKKGMGTGGMSGGGMGMMGKDKGMKMGMMSKGMMMMGKMKSMGDMDMPSSLPGFPGASHIYHIGADSFFLDHAEHITLTTLQQTALNKVKEEAMLKQADFDRQIESAEQEVWVLTSSDSPDAKQIEEKISEVAKLQADQRISYIRAVGEAAQTLTGEQRSSLTGATNNEEAEK